ncbi:MAG: acyl-CoA dehydrogenase family protein [Actinomycetes bacterium]
MDFDFTPDQDEAAALARRILTDRCAPERLAEVERTGRRFDESLWREVGDAGLLGLGLPEELGGGGLGLLETCSVLVEVGRAVAPLPLAWHAAAADLLARSGTDGHRDLVADAATGRSVLTVALAEDHAHVALRPATTVARTPDGWRVTGSKTVVPAGTVADLVVVPASVPAPGSPSDDVVLLLVRPDDPGVTLLPQTTNDGDEAARLELDGATLAADRALTRGPAALQQLVDRVTVLLCAQQLGVVEGALTLTAGYAGTREQFGRPIGTFQAVSQRLADGYIDVQGARLTLWQAAWRLAEGLPASVEVAVAKLWAADAGHRLAHTTVHVHGGVGIDLDGTAHRYFSAAKRLEMALGSSTEQALAVGRSLAADPA